VARLAQVFAGDPNDDSYPDLAVGSSLDRSIALLMNKGGDDPDSGGKFHPPIGLVLGGARPTSLWIRELNNDGYNDKAVCFYGTSSMCLLFDDPQNPGTFSSPVYFSLGYVPQFIT